MTEKIMSKGIQCRVQNSEYHIHVQAIGPMEMNRPYGGAWELRAPPEVVTWCEEQTPIYKSAASNGVYYVEMNVLMFNTGEQALLIHGEEFNHPDGMMIGCNPKSPAVKAVIEYAYQTDMMTNAVFNEKVNAICLAQSPTVTEGEPAVDEELSAALHPLVQHIVKNVNKDSPFILTCNTCGDELYGNQGITPNVSCNTCNVSMCEQCYFTPECEYCDEEIHEGVMVWCGTCAEEHAGLHVIEDCEEYCTIDGCIMAKPCNCTQVLLTEDDFDWKAYGFSEGLTQEKMTTKELKAMQIALGHCNLYDEDVIPSLDGVKFPHIKWLWTTGTDAALIGGWAVTGIWLPKEEEE